MGNRKETVSQLKKELTAEMPGGSPQFSPENREKTAPQNNHVDAKPATAAGAVGQDNQPKEGKPAAKGDIDPKQFAHLKDKAGFAFDPEKHEIKKDGTPKLSKNGLLCRKPGRQKKPQSRVFPGAQPLPEQTAEPLPGTETAHYQAVGAFAASMLFNAGMMIDADEWQPAEHERAMLTDAFANYARAQGVEDIPPGLALVIAVGSYVGPRMVKQKTRGKLGRFIDKWKNRKQKKAPPKDEKPDAPKKDAPHQ